ncbi:OB-fold putative lipoprotein [Flavobacteriaceae bacterium F08102]|nr:OB-fold putative lipoprotein [Flavobacteriaceae bacterium F08102]
MAKYVKIFIAIILLALGVVAYFWFMPHRDVQATKAFAEVEAADLVNEFITNRTKANQRYLADDGDSKVLVVIGIVVDQFKDQSGQAVILLKTNTTDQMGVSCTFTEETNTQVAHIKIGDKISVKGVIRSGAEIDKDLDLIEHVVLEKCAIIN